MVGLKTEEEPVNKGVLAVNGSLVMKQGEIQQKVKYYEYKEVVWVTACLSWHKRTQALGGVGKLSP